VYKYGTFCKSIGKKSICLIGIANMNVSFFTWLKMDLHSFTLTPIGLSKFALAWTWMRDFTFKLTWIKNKFIIYNYRECMFKT
jgi:hypothetical protein